MSDDLLKYAPLRPAEQPYTSIPAPKACCKVTVLPVGKLWLPGFLFVKDYEGDMYLPDYAFLLEHEESGRKVLFDFGLRKDLDYGEAMKPLFDIWHCEAPKSAQEVLKAAGTPMDQVDTIFFSHAHFDHIGDVTDVPASTRLLFGLYEDQDKFKSRKPMAELLHLDESAIEGKRVECLSEEDAWQKVGAFRGLDFFGDGSFYLLDTPGHFDGHLAGLVCVAKGPNPRYYLLGGDTAHHICLIDYKNPAAIGVIKAKDNPLSPLRESDPDHLLSFEHNLGTSYKTMAGMAKMENEANIVTLLAHDESLDGVFAEFGNLENAIELNGSEAEFEKFKKRPLPEEKRTLKHSH